MARLKDVKLPKKRDQLEKALGFKRSSPKKLREILNAPGKSTIPKAKIKKAISEARKRRTRTVKKR